jgi:hypothetical protein
MENNDTPLHRFLTMKRKSQEASQSRFAEESRKRLDKIISTKLTTTFIKKDHERTEEEKELYTIWESIRTEVLNNGNNQLRALRNELQNHNILWNRHTLVIKNNEENSDVNDA